MSVYLSKYKMMTTDIEEITPELIQTAIQIHMEQLLPIYEENERMYMSDYDILKEPGKEPWKPDNRLVINYAKYIVDTFGGYHIGIPMKMHHEDNQVADFITNFRDINDMEDTDYEIGKDMDIFGHGYAYVYQDEESQTRVTYEAPLNMFMIYDNSIQSRPVCAVRYMLDVEGYLINSEVITNQEHIQLGGSLAEKVLFLDTTPHIYPKIPVIEFILNEERLAIFESVKSLINALNKTASEKANEVDYFADAYLKIVGVELDEEDGDYQTIRSNRIINLFGDNPQLDANFLEKPSADTTQENLISLLKEAIFSISMVANMSEMDFGSSSGTALAFKLQGMDNMARMKDRKMQSAFGRLYEVVFSVPNSGVHPDDYRQIEYTFTRNVPRNVREEAEVAQLLDGQVSLETKLSVLSIVDNAQDEMERMESEEQQSDIFSRLLKERENQLADQDLQEPNNGVIAGEQ